MPRTTMECTKQTCSTPTSTDCVPNHAEITGCVGPLGTAQFKEPQTAYHRSAQTTSIGKEQLDIFKCYSIQYVLSVVD